ncbi:nuclear pore complex protein Nup98-Nup96-like [Ostrinia nubilalis]|uniref:nuclear pore complex protein Nup98-Nup96-like n=1 Tax=Ostrinia nubilalis TaxID=29057 RepID=UPI0030822445
MTIGCVLPCEEGQCPQLQVKKEPKDRRELLNKHLRDARQLNKSIGGFGVSRAYCYEVWKLCDALWGADLDNDGVPGTDVASVVNRYHKLLEWLREAVAETTDNELSKPSKGETEDEEDGHSSRVWSLLLGGRVLEACKLCRERGDLNMAVLIAQAAGSPTFRSLLSRQLSQWRACGADAKIAKNRFAALRLLAGEKAQLEDADWLRALHATARYLCPQVPTLERIVRKYESFFSNSTEEEEEIDLSLVEVDEMSMKLPLPPYMSQCEMRENDSLLRVLDLRYELIRARATNGRPRLRPASYSPDPLDYSLCFLLGTWFGHPTIDSITGVADQLEACGLWHLAVQALAFHPDAVARGHLIRGVLSRYAPAKADTPELTSRLELIAKLRVPAEWVLLARAHRAKYETGRNLRSASGNREKYPLRREKSPLRFREQEEISAPFQ